VVAFLSLFFSYGKMSLRLVLALSPCETYAQFIA
jgi:hypothetical protein